MPLKLSTRLTPKHEQLEHQRLTSLINSMADAVIAVDENLKIVIYNSAALNILDVNNIKSNTPIASLLKPIDKDNQPMDIGEMIKASKLPFTNRDLRVKYTDGSIINLYTSIAPVHLGYGAKGEGGHVILLRDITREKSLEEERDEFISVVSHELRTPIAIAEGNLSNAQLIAQKALVSDTIQQTLNEAHKQVLYLSDMINDLSTLSRAERGVLNVNVEGINVHEIVNDLIKSYAPEAKNRSLYIKSEIDPKLELLNSSRLYVREILQNFITNALKYTTRGGVTVRVHNYEKGICFLIEDTGIGISKADQERVYDKFFRSEDYRTRQANGTGLGLYVTLKLAHLIHADLKLESELNKGSVFSVYIPNLK